MMGSFEVAVGLLFLLALIDLSVGVSNDAVNFLNSAIGSRVPPGERHHHHLVHEGGFACETSKDAEVYFRDQSQQPLPPVPELPKVASEQDL